MYRSSVLNMSIDIIASIELPSLSLKVEMLPDIAHAPRILPNYAQHIPVNLKKVGVHTVCSNADMLLSIGPR